MMINKRLINLCNESKKYVALTVLVSWISILCNILIILLIGKFINRIYLGEELVVTSASKIISDLSQFKMGENLTLLGTIGIIIILLIIRYVSNLFYGKFSYLASANARVTLRELIYKKLLKLGTSYNEVESTSSLVQFTVEGVEALEVYFGKYLPQFFYSMLAPITLFVVLSFISFKSAIVFILCVPLIPVSIIAIMKLAKKILKNYWKSYSNLGDTFLENLQGLTTLKVFNRDEERHNKMNDEAEKFRKVTMKVLSMQLNSINIMDLIAFGGAALGTIVALFQFRSGVLLIGDLLIIILLSSEFFIPLRLLGSFFHIAMNGMAASDRIFALLDVEERKKELANGYDEMNDISITLNDVDFSYDGKRKVIENANMEVPNKGLVAIVGESGSGKSTIASLILNSYKVNSGEIKFNNINVDNIPLDTIYSKVSLISTNSYIFNGSILDNLLMANKDATKEEIENALKVSRLYEFIISLKEGLLTNVGEGGSLLSGGQKQRLALARAILSNREVMIFDEATSNIDVESEEDIWKAIYDLSKTKTIIVISHRLANVIDADKIYVMKKGHIVESGTHEELYDSKKLYYNMINKQRELEEIRVVM
ncbi:ABC transporter ATP-binding protein/permease [Clostridium septicum]|uniref:ABC transporter ATP-binding protein/permease n=1 Tax=Clostridium septicum TaxID=1504 RepID=UPI000833E4DA|nr:ABC transporter ATP-binding protein/permease [Clostridium septicum]